MVAVESERSTPSGAVADRNGSTRPSVDWIVRAVIVKPEEAADELLHCRFRRTLLQIRRDHLRADGVVAALAACVTWVVTALAFDTGSSGSVSNSQATATHVGAAQQAPATFTMTRKQIEGSRRWRRRARPSR